MSREEEILAIALSLPDSARAHIADELLQSLVGEGQAEMDALWAQEAESRIDAVERGDIEAVPGPEALSALKARFGE